MSTTDTPRTNQAIVGLKVFVPADFARELERELNEAHAENEKQARLLGISASKEAKLQSELTEVLDAIRHLYTVCPTEEFINWVRLEHFVEYSKGINSAKEILKKHEK